MTDMPELIWAKDELQYGAVVIGRFADTVRYLPDGTMYRRADLPPKVKPLEWHQIREEPIIWMGHPAYVNSLDYVVRLTSDNPDVFAFGLDGEGWMGFHDTLEAAQAAAQADYTAAILAALVQPAHHSAPQRDNGVFPHTDAPDTARPSGGAPMRPEGVTG